MAIVWTADLDTGIKVIDQQHRRLADYINQLEDANGPQSRERVGKVMKDLIEYTISHFAFEESMLEEANYQFIVPHKRVHELFVRRINEYRDRFEAGEDVTADVTHMLGNWLINHIKREDGDYVSAVRPRINSVVGDSRSGGWLSRSLKRFFG